MSLSLFMYFADPTGERRIAPSDLARVVEAVRIIPSLTEGLIFTPPGRVVEHPFMDDGTPPVLALQLRFPDLASVEAATAADGVVAELAATRGLPSLEGLDITHQAMVTRPFPVDDPRHPPGTGSPCSYLVHYPGAAEDLNAWLRHYLEHHPAIMRTFPGIRQIEIFTRIDWVDALPSRRVNYMQRNKLVFDSPEALSASLLSDVIKNMRADFRSFPPFTGGNIHYPMSTLSVVPGTGGKA
jgi:uncharacterized protein (TIGR02118 family)